MAQTGATTLTKGHTRHPYKNSGIADLINCAIQHAIKVDLGGIDASRQIDLFLARQIISLETKS